MICSGTCTVWAVLNGSCRCAHVGCLTKVHSWKVVSGRKYFKCLENVEKYENMLSNFFNDDLQYFRLYRSNHQFKLHFFFRILNFIHLFFVFHTVRGTKAMWVQFLNYTNALNIWCSKFYIHLFPILFSMFYKYLSEIHDKLDFEIICCGNGVYVIINSWYY